MDLYIFFEILSHLDTTPYFSNNPAKTQLHENIQNPDVLTKFKLSEISEESIDPKNLPPSNWSAAGILGPGLVHFQIMILNDYVSPADGVILKGITDGNGD